jgi:ubiquinone/menaquinone biosynthesis C-methylase UbiE
MWTSPGKREAGAGTSRRWELDVTLENVARYEQRLGSVCRAERRIIAGLSPGMSVLELGCGDGRVTLPLAERGVRVWGCDISFDPLRALRRRGNETRPAGLLQADARRLPVADASVDVVMFAFAGIDMVVPEDGRIRVIQEAERVLKPGGKFIFSSHNPIGRIFSPRGVRREWRSRLAFLRARAMGKTYVRSRRGLLMYQGTPRRVARTTEKASGMRLARSMTGHSGISGPLWLLSLVSKRPYYLFAKDRG